MIEDLEEYSKFADALAKVQAVHDELMGGIYEPTPQIIYTFVNSKPKAISLLANSY